MDMLQWRGPGGNAQSPELEREDCGLQGRVPIPILSVLVLLSKAFQIQFHRGEISVLKGPGWCTQKGQTAECGSMHASRTQRPPS